MIADELQIRDIREAVENLELSLQDHGVDLREDPDDAGDWLVGYGQSYAVARFVELYQRIKEILP